MRAVHLKYSGVCGWNRHSKRIWKNRHYDTGVGNRELSGGREENHIDGSAKTDETETSKVQVQAGNLPVMEKR